MSLIQRRIQCSGLLKVLNTSIPDLFNHTPYHLLLEAFSHAAINM